MTKLILPTFWITSLLLAGAAAGADPVVPPQLRFREQTSPNGVAMKYVLYVPDQTGPTGRYPLVVYLHGRCEECAMHERIAQESGLRMWHGYDRNEQREPTLLFAPVGATQPWADAKRREAAFEIIDGLLRDFPVDQRRIYILGFSMGGWGTWDWIQQRPGFFAAANPQAAGPQNVDAELVKNTPIWATIGDEDRPASIERTREHVARIRAANGDDRGAQEHVTGVNPRLTIFPHTGHGAAQGATQQMPGFLDWFYGQVNDGNAPPSVWFAGPGHKESIPAGQSIAVTVKTNDAEGPVGRVEVLVDGGQVGAGSGAPFTYSVGSLAAGEHRLAARAIDGGGKSSTAEIVVDVSR